MTKGKHFAPHFKRAHCFEQVPHRGSSSLLAPNCGKFLVAHQRKARFGKAFRTQDHTLPVTNCPSAQAMCYLPLLSPVCLSGSQAASREMVREQHGLTSLHPGPGILSLVLLHTYVLRKQAEKQKHQTNKQK